MQLRIEKIITGGFGLARREDGPVVLTRFVLPGETVAAREIKRHRGHVEAELLQVLAPAPERVAPACPFYALCGGCDFQHIDYPAQLSFKAAMVAEALQRSGLTPDPEMLQPILPSPRPYGYRYRIRLKLDARGELGFFRFRSNRIVAIDRCPVATEQLNLALMQLHASAFPKTAAAAVQEIDLLHSPADHRIHLLLLPRTGQRVNPAPLAACAPELSAIHALWLQTATGPVRIDGGDAPALLRQDFPSTICGLAYSLGWPPGAFSQVNARQNEELLALVLHLAGNVRGCSVLDLFCGMGNFAVPLGLAGALVTGVERSGASVARAGQNAAAAGCLGAGFIAADVAAALASPAIAGRRFDLIVLDPPRQGLERGCDRLAALAAPRIIYISCDPATLMRDLTQLCALGYRLARLTPVDMFPQTHHIEAVALLEKN